MNIIKIGIVVLVTMVCLFYYPYLTPDNITEYIESNNVMAPLLFIVICTIRPVLFFMPSMGLTIVAGVLFGAVWGTVYVAIGGAFSSIVGFYFARWLGRDAAKKMAQFSKHMKRMDEWAGQYGKNAVLSMRLFNLPWDIVSYWAGISGVKFKEFYIASLLPLIHISFLYTYFGSKVFQPDSAGFIISLVIMFMLGAIPFIRRRINRNAHG